MAAPAWASPYPQALSDEDYHSFSPARAKIGQLLFYDKVLSGNRNISCGTCHHHRLVARTGCRWGLARAVSVSGRNAMPGPANLPSRNACHECQRLWNLGAKAFTVLFHDGRLALADDFDNGFNTPAEEWLPHGLETVLGRRPFSR